jgi:uncharacterized protein (DUF1330 family)
MAYVVIRHEISDLERLKQVYTDDAERRRRLGCIGGRLLREVDHRAEVTVQLEFDTTDHARAFAGSFELEQALHWSTAKAPTTRVLVYEEVHSSPY